jgi:hypothetical protein
MGARVQEVQAQAGRAVATCTKLTSSVSLLLPLVAPLLRAASSRG